MAVSKDGTVYDLTGPVDAPVVVLIHGLGMNRDITWRGIAPVLAKRYRVLTYDLCGHGETVVPTAPVNLTLLSEQVIALMDELDIARAALVGFSLGGMINRRCAMDHPSRVSALGVLNSPHERGEEQQKLVEARARDTAAGGPGATIDATLARWFTPAYLTGHADVVEEVRQIVLANDHANYAAHRQVLAEGVVELIRPTPPITHPTLVMTCEHDSGSTPAMSHGIAAEIEGAKTMIVPDLQHLGLIEQPDLFTAPLLEFLAQAAQ
ncbi:MAG: alpha/beta fold hydrolase [Paracoccaceae bacterium]